MISKLLSMCERNKFSNCCNLLETVAFKEVNLFSILSNLWLRTCPYGTAGLAIDLLLAPETLPVPVPVLVLISVIPPLIAGLLLLALAVAVLS